MMPYCKNHHLMMQKFTDGLKGNSFYQKDSSTYLPEWLSGSNNLAITDEIIFNLDPPSFNHKDFTHISKGALALNSLLDPLCFVSFVMTKDSKELYSYEQLRESAAFTTTKIASKAFAEKSFKIILHELR